MYNNTLLRGTEDAMIINSQSLYTNDAANTVYEKYSATVFRIAFVRTKNTYDAEDITQEVFIRYIRKNPSFESEGHEKAWFIRVALNCSKSLLSSSWYKRTEQINNNADLSISPNPFEEESEVFHAVSKLSAQMRIVVHLFYYEEYKVQEIAQMLGKTESSIKSTLMRARKKLAKLLRTEEEREGLDDV